MSALRIPILVHRMKVRFAFLGGWVMLWFSCSVTSCGVLGSLSCWMGHDSGNWLPAWSNPRFRITIRIGRRLSGCDSGDCSRCLDADVE